MIRKLKMVMVAVVAILALGVMGASAAPAAEFHGESGTTILDGEQTDAFNDKFTFDAATVECKNATYLGAVSGATTSTMSTLFVYDECKSTFETNAPIDDNDCEYVFHGTTSVDIVCGGTIKYIAVTKAGCEITVPAQTGIKGTIDYTNHGAGSSRHITVHVTLEKIKYIEHDAKFFPTCAADNTTKEKTNGILHGSATMKGTTFSGVGTGIWYQ